MSKVKQSFGQRPEACGVIVEDEAPIARDIDQNQMPLPDDKKAMGYLKTVLDEKVELVGMESVIANNFKIAIQQHKGLFERLRVLEAQVKEVKEQIQKTSGQCDAYSALLLNAEAERSMAEAEVLGKEE